ncbi:MAG: hypothetical protein AB1410_08700 [Acidobacteriota bacterium]
MVIRILIFLILVLCIGYSSQNLSESPEKVLFKAKEMIEKGENQWVSENFLKAKSLLQEALKEKFYIYLFYYYIALSDYRLSIYHLQAKDKKKAKDFIEEGIKNLERSIKEKGDFSDSYALLGALLGLKISISWYLAPSLGPKSSKEIEKAIQLDPDNPRAYLIKGISSYNTPVIFGGGVSKATKDLELSIKLFEKEKKDSSIEPSWGMGEAYARLGLCYIKKGDKKKAEEIFIEGISKAPEYSWLRHHLEKLKKSHKEVK